MSRFTPILVAVCLAVTGFAATANGGIKRHYSHAYYSAADRCGGKDAVGRNVRREGHTLSNGKHVTNAKYRVLTGRLDSMCRPQPKPVVVSQATSTHTATNRVASTSTTAAPSSGLAQCIVQRESGGNAQAVNPNGHSGLGQWDQQTWEAQGGTKYGATPTSASAGDQMRVLNNALAHGQSGAWTPYDGC